MTNYRTTSINRNGIVLCTNPHRSITHALMHKRNMERSGRRTGVQCTIRSNMTGRVYR